MRGLWFYCDWCQPSVQLLSISLCVCVCVCVCVWLYKSSNTLVKLPSLPLGTPLYLLHIIIDCFCLRPPKWYSSLAALYVIMSNSPIIVKCCFLVFALSGILISLSYQGPWFHGSIFMAPGAYRKQQYKHLNEFCVPSPPSVPIALLKEVSFELSQGI